MKKLIDRNRKAQIMTKLHLSLQKYDNFKQTSKLSNHQLFKESNTNDQLTRQLSKLLESNQRKKNDLKQKLISGPVEININQEMTELRQRMDILRQHHQSKRTSKSYQSLTGKQLSQSNLIGKFKKLTFDELYNLQKQKFSSLRERRKSKRLNLQYLQAIGNKQGRKQRNKQLIQEKFAQQMRLLDEAIQSN